MTASYATPGVYIQEINAFPNSVVPVQTAVPAFIGYTPAAAYQGKSYANVAVKITSFADFQAYFMLPDPPPPLDPAVQYTPGYYLVAQKAQPASGEYILLDGVYYAVLPDPSTIYYLYNSVRLFYQNGGGDAYIVSVGTYGAASGKPITDPAAQIVNPNVKLADLQRGLALLKNEQEPTMYLCPDATLMSLADNAILNPEMLQQAAAMGTAVCLLDIIGGAQPDPIQYTDDIANFRGSTGTTALDHGISYYPFIGTTIMQTGELNFTNLFGSDTTRLNSLLSPASAPNPQALQILTQIQHPPAKPMTNRQLQAALVAASPVYARIMASVTESANILPPSGAMAGVYTVTDNTDGPWCSPANCPITGAVSLPIRLSDSQQATLNIDEATGKSINAIRLFNGLGILVWGARTLDGNSQDWRYIAVRRTMIYLEQSIREGARAYVFQPNDANTWAAVKSMIGSFLTNVWKQGGLQGASPGEAYQVDVGLGVTMTPEDIQNGIMRVTLKVAMQRPAEFIVITFEQQQATSD